MEIEYILGFLLVLAILQNIKLSIRIDRQKKNEQKEREAFMKDMRTAIYAEVDYKKGFIKTQYTFLVEMDKLIKEEMLKDDTKILEKKYVKLVKKFGEML